MIKPKKKSTRSQVLPLGCGGIVPETHEIEQQTGSSTAGKKVAAAQSATG